MTKLNFEQMERFQGGVSKESATGAMCGAAVVLACVAFPFSAIAVAPAIGCLAGLLS